MLMKSQKLLSHDDMKLYKFFDPPIGILHTVRSLGLVIEALQRDQEK